jgi:hypothetical protein
MACVYCHSELYFSVSIAVRNTTDTGDHHGQRSRTAPDSKRVAKAVVPGNGDVEVAARLNPKQDERTRSAIRTTQLVKRLQAFALSETDDANQKVEMTADQVRAALGLIKKTLPDLTSTTLSGDENNPVRGKMEVVFVQPSQD